MAGVGGQPSGHLLLEIAIHLFADSGSEGDFPHPLAEILLEGRIALHIPFGQFARLLITTTLVASLHVTRRGIVLVISITFDNGGLDGILRSGIGGEELGCGAHTSPA